jgi:hypothetical protein
MVLDAAAPAVDAGGSQKVLRPHRVYPRTPNPFCVRDSAP